MSRQMFDAYVEAALWSSTDDQGQPLDARFTKYDFSEAALTSMRHDVGSFLRQNEALIDGDYSRAGHDFWLTRNRHGAGFWDGDWPEPAATRLTESAHAFGESDVYVGDDGKLHVTGEHRMLAAVSEGSDTAVKVGLGALILAAAGFGWYVATSNKIA